MNLIVRQKKYFISQWLKDYGNLGFMESCSECVNTTWEKTDKENINMELNLI